MAPEVATAGGRDQRRQLLLGTLSFTVCFAVWGLVGAFAKEFQSQLGLTASQTAVLVAVPVLLGSVARIPMGLLADRQGGRPVFAVLMAAVALPALMVPAARSYGALLVLAFCVGLAGASFPIGISFVSRWTPRERQGAALGIYALGNAGQSLAVFGGPVLAYSLGWGWENVFRLAAGVTAVWAVGFALLGRDAPGERAAPGLAAMLADAARERLCWVLSAFYFLTFGGFVAFSVYLPTLLADLFGLSRTDAGLRAAGFVILATVLRPVGGWLSDRVGAARVLAVVFGGVVPFALLLAWPVMVPFTVGALGCAALMGLGNGAVYKLVAEYFPDRTGTVGGVVGALGGLGGFFPPILLGLCQDHLHVRWPGFVLLAATAGLLYAVNQRVFEPLQEESEQDWPPELRRVAEALRAGAWATLVTGLLIAAIVVGSRNLEYFDAALVVYTFAVIFATWGLTYHYYVWLQKPPTRVYWRRGWELARRGGWAAARSLVTATGTHLLAQTFIRRRSPLRWWMHQLLFWGCLLAVAITFPLVFGWVHFTSAPDDQMRYVAHVFGFEAFAFPARSLMGWMIFHGLDFSAILVLGGVSLALWRRLRDEGAQAVQHLQRDFQPLVLLFAISVTGLMLTASSLWLRGALYEFLALTHQVTVVAGLLYLPFGKFFHIFQRPAQLGVKLYQQAGDAGEGAFCAGCGERYASRLQIDDLKREALPPLGFDYRGEDGAAHWQDLCGACKRKAVATAQLGLMAAAGLAPAPPEGD